VLGRLLSAVALAALARGAYDQLVRGGLTVDLDLGRSLRPLGPFVVPIAAPRETVFEVVAAPYLGRPTRALAEKLRVLERGEDMVLAAHFTKVGKRMATTVETVRFERPERIHFRLVRGPVPHVVEQFAFEETREGTELTYTGELGTDLWVVGRAWGDQVARRWEAAVRKSLEAVRVEAERQASRSGSVPGGE